MNITMIAACIAILFCACVFQAVRIADLKQANGILEQQVLSLENARIADRAAFDALQQAEQEARHAAVERQKTIEAILSASSGADMLDALRMFGKAVCEHDPATGGIVCAGEASGTAGKPAIGTNTGRVVWGGGNHNK